MSRKSVREAVVYLAILEIAGRVPIITPNL